MIVRKTTPAESQRVNELFAIAFEQPIENGPADSENQQIHHWAAFEDDNRKMMSAFTISDHSVHFDGHCCKMGGIGGVSTLPQYRRKGGIRGCFQNALPNMYRNGYDFSYLYPFSTGYYRKFGYESCVQKYRVTLQLGLLNPPKIQGHYVLAEKNDPMTDAIRSIDRHWENRFNMMVIHPDTHYDWCSKADPAIQQEFTYVYFDAEAQPKAYTTFRKADEPDGRNLICSRFCFLDKDGFSGLMNLFQSLASDHMFVKFALPTDTAMQYLLPEWSMGAAQWSVVPAGMVRVIHVKQVLEKARYRGSGVLHIAIQDPQIPENNAVFSVAFSDGKAVRVETDQHDPDVLMDISTFSALICGVSDFADAAQWFNGLQIIHENACFDRVFYRKKLFIADYF